MPRIKARLEKQPKRGRPWLLAAVLLVAAIAFSGALDAPFQFDDIPSIPQNRTIERIWPPGPALSPPPQTAVSGRPVVNLSLAANYALNAAIRVDQLPD